MAVCGINHCKRKPSNKKVDIEKHIEEKHEKKSKVANDDKTIKCCKCDYTCKEIHPLRVHYGMAHKKDIEGHTCLICTHTGKFKSNVKRHIIHVHKHSPDEAEKQIGVIVKK